MSSSHHSSSAKEGEKKKKEREEGETSASSASPSPSPSTSTESKAPLNSKVFDFTSEYFRAEDALANPVESLTRLPEPRAKLFNNISEYANKTFKKSAIEACTKKSKVDLSQPVIERKFTQEQINALVPTKKPKQPENILTLMAKAEGPLALLKKSVGQTVRILVMKNKSSHKSRLKVSWMSARLIAFDKHFNLILHDVIELVPETTQDVCDRLFLRGDNVIAVAKGGSNKL